MTQLINNQFLLSVIVILFVWLTKFATSTYIKRKYQKEAKDRRELVNTIKNSLNILMVIAIFSIWSQELQKFAISIAAFVVAIVLATREIIQCVIGFIYLTSTKTFRVGDWVQIGEFTGEVTATDWAKITIMEVELRGYGYTGKTLFVPNSLLLTKSIKNLTYMKRYVNHSFVLSKEVNDINTHELREKLLAKAVEYCSDFQETAIRYSAHLEKKLDITISDPEPNIKLGTTELGVITFTITMFCPTELAKPIEQYLTADFFSIQSELKKALSEEDSIKDESKNATASSMN